MAWARPKLMLVGEGAGRPIDLVLLSRVLSFWSFYPESSRIEPGRVSYFVCREMQAASECHASLQSIVSAFRGRGKD